MEQVLAVPNQLTVRKPTAKGKMSSHPLKKKDKTKNKTKSNLHCKTRCLESLMAAGMPIRRTMGSQIPPLTKATVKI